MKKFSTGLLLAIPIFLFSQNWQLLNPRYRYYYGNKTIFIDSDINADTIIYDLNRITTLKSTNSISQIDTFLINQPDFLQRKVSKQSGDYTFYDTTSFLIKSTEEIGGSWVFDTSNNVTAEIIAKNYIDVFGVLDSTKTILTSNNDTIIFSKENGIIFFKINNIDLSLTGIRKEFVKHGNALYDYKDYYDYSIGDIFQYAENRDFFGEATSYGGYSSHYKIEILTRTDYSDSIVYTANLKKFIENYATIDIHNPIDTHYYDQTITFVHLADQFSESYEKQLVPFFFDNYGSNQHFSIVSGNEIKVIGEVGYEKDFLNNVVFTDPYSLNERIIEVGKGITKETTRLFESSFYKTLIGYKKNGIQTGTIYEDYFYTNVSSLEKSKSFCIYPNPIDKYLNIYLEKKYTKLQVYIRDSNGKTYFFKEYKQDKNIIINVENFPKGVYWVDIDAGLSNRSQSFIKR